MLKYIIAGRFKDGDKTEVQFNNLEVYMPDNAYNQENAMLLRRFIPVALRQKKEYQNIVGIIEFEIIEDGKKVDKFPDYCKVNGLDITKANQEQIQFIAGELLLNIPKPYVTQLKDIREACVKAYAIFSGYKIDGLEYEDILESVDTKVIIPEIANDNDIQKKSKQVSMNKLSQIMEAYPEVDFKELSIDKLKAEARSKKIGYKRNATIEELIELIYPID